MQVLSRLRFLWLWSVLLLAACGEDRLAALPADATIVAFGDSLTRGVGAQPDESYPAVLAHLTGLRVINAGVSGETTGEGRERLPEVLEAHRPDLLILLEGGNDILRNRTAAAKKNLAAMIEMAQAAGVPVILVAVPEKKLLSNAAPWYAELAAEYDLVLEDELIGGLMRSAQYKSDPVHFNAAGYARIAERLHELLTESGAL